jgi:class 3 adenylate cyclase
MDIRAGIAFGGPLIGDVFSPDAPGFDLIGPVVDEAIEIRTGARPGGVYVSASVQGLLKPYLFTSQAVTVPGRKAGGVFQIRQKAPE